MVVEYFCPGAVYTYIYKRASLACAARLADTKCPPEAPFGRLGSHWLIIREIISLNMSILVLKSISLEKSPNLSIFSATPIGRCPYGMDGVSRPSVRPYVCVYVRTRATAKSNSPYLPNFAYRISLCCRSAPSTFFHKISSLPVFISIYSYFNTSTVKFVNNNESMIKFEDLSEIIPPHRDR